MSRPLRILITGSRAWDDRQTIDDAITRAWSEHGPRQPLHLILGDAGGADSIAHDWALHAAGFRHLAVTFDRHRADWRRHGRAAGPLRNAAMVAGGADLVLAFAATWDSGTGQCARLARKAGIPVIDYGVDTAPRGGAR